ncbi:MAG: hypothetical protein WD055_03115 [Candidatus Dependentiae bacterium]
MYKSNALFLCIILQVFYIHAEPKLVHREEFQTVKMSDDDDQKIIVKYNISQQCNIENNQSNQVTTPIVEKNNIEHETTTTSGIFSQLSYKHILGPLGLSALGCVGYALYYAKTKFNLYSLSKACVENALWSVWKNKTNGNLPHEHQDTDLMMDILQTYNTDRYAIAISHFLQDVEREMDILKQYIREAESAQSGALKFVFDDFTYEILEAKARISNLSDLRKLVLGWLKNKSHKV